MSEHTRWDTDAHKRARALVNKNYLAGMFDVQRLFQARLGHDFETKTPEEQIEYVKIMILAIQDELMEALHETRWKPWATGEKMIVDRDKFGGELIDVLHFLLNLFLVNGWNEEDVFTAFWAKQNVNWQRQQNGYNAHSTKCANKLCRRALDEPGNPLAYVRPGTADLGWCNDGCYDAWVEAGDDVIAYKNGQITTLGLTEDEINEEIKENNR
jgi:dimeric dUTPase (all-alpha-NTP-PPase superfamily)